MLTFNEAINLNGEEIYGYFDERTNFGLITFDKEIFENKVDGLDYYYLLKIYNNMNMISNIPIEIYTTSKESPESSLLINKYVSGSFNLTKNFKQFQKYYINIMNQIQIKIILLNLALIIKILK